jgi:phage tail-like protein
MRIDLKGKFNLNGDPYRAFRFLVEISGLAVGAFTRFSGIKMQVQTIQARAGNDGRGVQQYVPVLTSFAPVTLSKGVIGSNEFINWLSAAASVGHGNPGGSTLKRNIDIIALNEAGSEGVIWTLQNAMPIGYELSPMDSSSSEVLSESVTFSFEGMQRTISEVTVDI